MIEPVTVILYIKQDCGLCEEMQSHLDEFLCTYQSETSCRIEIEQRDIEDNAEWYAQFREYVPTVVVNGQEVCHYFFDADELKEALECPSHT